MFFELFEQAFVIETFFFFLLIAFLVKIVED